MFCGSHMKWKSTPSLLHIQDSNLVLKWCVYHPKPQIFFAGLCPAPRWGCAPDPLENPFRVPPPTPDSGSSLRCSR